MYEGDIVQEEIFLEFFPIQLYFLKLILCYILFSYQVKSITDYPYLPAHFGEIKRNDF